MPKTEMEKKVARESLHCTQKALEACMSLMMHKGKVGAVGTTNAAPIGEY
jgi:hypothetical protein